MLKSLFMSSILIICILISCNTTPPVDTDIEVTKIRELDSLWQEAMNERDCEKTASFFASDGLMMPSNAPAIRGIEKITEYFKGWLPNENVISTFSPETIEVAGSGDLAYDRGTFHFEMETPDGTYKSDGKYIIIWKKIDGKWKAIADISNSDI